MNTYETSSEARLKVWWHSLGSRIFMIVALWMAGCAGHPTPDDSSVAPSMRGSSDSITVRSVDVASQDPSYLHRIADRAGEDPARPLAEPPPDEPFDPFAKPDEALGEEYDPWESMNTKIFEFNRQMDRWVLKPVAQGYDFVVPDFVQVGISNMFTNLQFAPRFFNNLFQGKLKGAGIEMSRFLLNTTVGYAGFLDLATEMGWVTPQEDTGQTLGVYGVGPGPYLVLPFLPPFTTRDLVGYVGDIFLNPINWLVAPIIEVNNVPSVIAHHNRTTTSIVQIGTRVGQIVNERSRNLEKFQGVEEATLDLYSAVRNGYLQSRARAIRE